MILDAVIAAAFYALSLLTLTVVGNALCRLVLAASGVTAKRPEATESTPPARRAPAPHTGRIIGSLERLLILVGMAAGRWEVVVAVVALKTIARYKELDRQIEAEYFLIGSLFSLIWAVIVSAVILHYDHSFGADISAALRGLAGG